MEQDYEHRLTAVEQRSSSNTHRIDKLEESTDAINKLATSMQVMGVKQDQVIDKVDRLDGKVEALEAKPGKRYEGLVEKIIWAVTGAVCAWLLSHLGL